MSKEFKLHRDRLKDWLLRNNWISLAGINVFITNNSQSKIVIIKDIKVFLQYINQSSYTCGSLNKIF